MGFSWAKYCFKGGERVQFEVGRALIIVMKAFSNCGKKWELPLKAFSGEEDKDLFKNPIHTLDNIEHSLCDTKS